jgi:hypothetical protein
MSEMMTVPPPIEPFRIGNVVKASVRLYRDRFKLYFGIGLRAVLWLFLPVLVVIPIGILGFLLAFLINAVNGQSSFFWVLFIIPVLMIVLIPISYVYGFAKFCLNIALISRLTFYELKGHPETENQGNQAIYRKLWMLCITQFLLVLIFSAWNGFHSAIQNVLASNIGTTPDIRAYIALTIVWFALWYIICLWLSARFQIADTSLVIESNLNALTAIARSWHLTKGYVWKIIGVGIVVFALLFPAYLLAFIPLAIGFVSKGSDLLTTISSPQLLISLLPSYLASLLLCVVIGIVILPLGPVVKGVIYYDLLTRSGCNRPGASYRLR